MLKLTKNGIGLLTKQYRSVLRKCLLLNFGLFMTTTFLNLTIPNTVEANGVEIGGGSAPHFLAVAIGSSVSAGGDYAIGIGNAIVASARDAIAVGGSANATNDFAVAYGAHAKATGEGSIALGAGSISSQKDVVSVGHLGSDSSCTGFYCGSDLFRRIVNVADGINAHDTVTLGQMNNALNYYYTKTEADARYAKLSGGNTFGGRQDFYSLGGARTVSIWDYDASGIISVYNKNSDSPTVMVNGSSSSINMFDVMSSSTVPTTILSSSSFKLNGSSSATGIDFAANVTAGTTNASHLATTGAVNQLLNYYYTKDEISNSSVWKLFGSANGNYYSASAGTASVISALDAQIKVNSDAITNVYTKSEVQNIQLLNYYYTKDDTNFLINQYHQMLYGSSGFAFNPNTGKVTNLLNSNYHAQSIQRNGNYTKSYIKYIDGYEYLNEDVTILDNIRYIDLAIGRVNAGHYVGAYSVNFDNNGGVTSINNTISDNINALDNALYNYYYTFRNDKISEAAEFALFLDNEKLSSVFDA